MAEESPYLGIPEKLHGSKAQVFAFVRDILQSRTTSWSVKFLSKGGKKVLIKSQAQAVPTYVMSCFLLPKAIRSKLSSAIAKFWWSSKADGRGIHWEAWDKVCTQLADGGLGFRTFEEFNLALLAKQLWRLLRFPESLLSRVLKGRYFKYCNPLEISVSNRPSYGWRSIMAAKPLLALHIRKTIASGFGTFVWSEPWIPDNPARPPRGIQAEKDPLLCVNTLIDFETKQWRMDRLRELFPPEDISLILGIRPSRNVSRDGYSWPLTKSGNYSVKSGYWTARALSRLACVPPPQGPCTSVLKAQAWKLKTTRKLKHSVWQCVSDCLATCERMVYRHIGREKGCPRCGADEETINHVIFECPPSKQVWALSTIPSAPNVFPHSSIFYNLDYLFWRAKELGASEEDIRVFPWIMWFIWKARNHKIFGNVEELPTITLDRARQEEEDWRKANTTEIQEVVAGNCSESGTPAFPTPPPLVCHIDGSWLDSALFSGHGWHISMGGRHLLLGLRGSNRCLSPLHAELVSLLWAMECTLPARVSCGLFATDCADLITMIECPDDWPTFASELDDFKSLHASFRSFRLTHVPRSLNTSADWLAKKARARGLRFSHVGSSVPDWLSSKEGLFLNC